MIHPRLQIIAAVAANGIIGKGNGLPWHLPDDLKRFKAMTLGHAMIMGRKTYETVGKPLPKRRTIVVSRSMPQTPGIEIAPTLESAIQLAETSEGTIFIAGGGVLYAAAMPLVGVMHLTEIDADVDGDASFPDWDRSGWRLAEVVRHPADMTHLYPFRFSTYERIR